MNNSIFPIMKLNFFIFCILLFFQLKSQNKSELYIDKYKSIAIAEMNEFGIPASITLAQGILESGNGESRLAVEGNNHFGIKCHNSWDGETIIEDDDERGECFRKYSDVMDSYRDHSLFLKDRSRYDFLFEYKITDYKKWARGLKKAGYATNPNYADLLIDIIKKYDLSQYDKSNINERNFFVSNIYGAPYLYGLGLNFYKEKYLIDLNIQSSFVYFNKLSVSYNHNLFNDFYLGFSSGMVAVSNQKEFNVCLSFQTSFLRSLKQNRRNEYQKISVGVDLVNDKDFNLEKIVFIPKLSFAYLF